MAPATMLTNRLPGALSHTAGVAMKPVTRRVGIYFALLLVMPLSRSHAATA